MGWLSILASPISSLITGVIGYFKHSSEMREVTRQKELEVEKTKVELAKQAETADQLTALEGLKEPLADRGFRKFLVIVMCLPMVGLLPDLFGFPQYGSMKVQEYMNLFLNVVPGEYRLFILSMIASYFGITKVKETFFSGK